MDLNVEEIKFISIVCLVEVHSQIEVVLTINKGVKFAISLTAIYILIAKAIEILK